MNILYATDGSECAGTAGRLLAVLPLLAGTHVTVLNVIADSDWIEYPMLPEMAARLAEAERDAAHQAADAAATSLLERSLDIEVRVRRGSPGEAILNQAAAESADLIVVGSHGRGGIARFLLGSVSERVARYAHCSVLVARVDTLRRVVLAVDNSPASEHALDAFGRLPLPRDLEATCIHVLQRDSLPLTLQPGEGLSGGAIFDRYAEQSHALGELILCHAQELLLAAGHKAATQVRCGTPAEELIAAAQEVDADLIVVGAANKSALGRLLLGSVSGRVLTHASTSVLVARSGNASDG
jgi:nucleotide-binding universal stress UspA family protein